MAFHLLRLFTAFVKPFKSTLPSPLLLQGIPDTCRLTTLKSVVPTVSQVRSTSIFNKKSAETLWKAVTSVSNAGRNRGRGKGLARKIRNLNKGQYLGQGVINMQWPGLNAPVVMGRTIVKQKMLPPDPNREANLIKMREGEKTRKTRRVHPLERGWTSAKLGGKSIGPPHPVNDETFDGFDSKVLEHKIVHHMTGNMGRKRSYSSFVITGNKAGLCGIALGKANDAKTSLRIAKNRAGAKLMYVQRYNDHTVYHDFFSQFGRTKLFVFKKPEGYGLKCHRALICACEVIGIKDLRVKVEGAINYQNILKAFLIGLLKQKTHEELAEEKKLHLVELRAENLDYPNVVASPSIVRKSHELKSTEIMDFRQYVLGGKVVLMRKKADPFYVNLPSWNVKLCKNEYIRNQDKVRLRMFAEHGEIRSFYTDQYPEAKPKLWNKKQWLKEQAQAAEAN